MKRKIEQCDYAVTPISVGDEFVRDTRHWLTKKAEEHGLATLLVHADDGVIWGKLVGGQLVLSSSVFPGASPPLRAVTLRQARLFGGEAEILIWRTAEDRWQARLLDDRGTDVQGWRFDEPQVQWGDHMEKSKQGFTLLAEGQEGLWHAVPLPASEVSFDLPPKASVERWHPIRLGVRHYLEHNQDDGTMVAVQGRLTGLWAEAFKEVNK